VRKKEITAKPGADTDLVVISQRRIV